MEQIFPYYFYIDEKELEITAIRIYGLNQDNKNICLKINNFTPYIYIELPNNIEWSNAKAQLIGNKIDEIMRESKPLKKTLVYKYRLYTATFDEKGERRTYPYLFCSFSCKNDIRVLTSKLRYGLSIVGIGTNLKLKVHEQDADPILQLISNRDLPTAGWISYKGEKVSKEEQVTLCDEEYEVKWKNMVKYDKDILAQPKIMGFDIEVNSSNPTAMPNASKTGDKIFQISCVFSKEGSTEYQSHLLTLGECEKFDDKVIVHEYKTEGEILNAFTNLIQKENPNVIVGYNILGFDIPYMIDRARLNMCIGEFDKLGFHKYNHAKERVIKWSSSAYKNQEFQFLDGEGRLFVDLLPLVKRDYKLDNYKLKTVSEHFLGASKDPLSVKGIFQCFRIGTTKDKDGNYSNRAKKAIALCGKYCVQDSVLVIQLMNKLQIWTGLCEMAKTTNCQIFTLYTQGQQIKVYSQVYKYCLENNYVVEKDGYITKENERYMGAHVFPPVPGIYDRVVPFDFSSLYPSIIIAYNIDYSTFVLDESIPNEKCHVMEWEEHMSCEHDPKIHRKIELTKYIEKEKEELKLLRKKRDQKQNKNIKQDIIAEIDDRVEKLKPFIEERSNIQKGLAKTKMCEKRKYRFLKEPKGVLPTILQNLLDARKKTRNQMKEYKKQGNDLLLNVLDKRQLSYKISANSMYGAMGVRKGYLPFMPGAMATTFMGRTNIEIVSKVIPEKYGGELVYGDTDSNYIHFPHIKSAEESWDYAETVAAEVSNLFRKPIKLEFEATIYWRFFILTKKRYMYRQCGRDGQVGNKIGKKGVLLARRDSSIFVRELYEQIIAKIFDRQDRYEILNFLLDEFNKLCSNSIDYKKFIITKSVGDTNNMETNMVIDDSGKTNMMIGDYKVPLLPTNESEKIEQLKKKEANSEEEYYRKCLPAQVQLANKMKKRGQLVQSGSRLEYIITDIDNHTGKQYDKIEDIDYFKNHKQVLTIDFFYYLKVAINSLDEVLNIAFKSSGGKYPFKNDFVLEQYNFRFKVRRKVINELKSIFKPKLIFE
jgi:DNA polymerase elongation subunit (family B)